MSELMDEARKAAQIIYDSTKDHDCQFLTFRWTVDQFITTMMTDQLATAFSVYDRLSNEGHTQDNPYVYNDLDNSAYILTDWKDLDRNKEKAFCLTDQNHNYLFRLIEDEVFGKSQMFLYRWESPIELHQLKERNGGRYNDLRDKQYLASSFDVIMGNRPQDAPVNQVRYVESALFNLNTVWLEDE